MKQVGQHRLIILKRNEIGANLGAGLLLERLDLSRKHPSGYALDQWKVEVLATGEQLLFSEFNIGRELQPLEVLAFMAQG